MTLALRPYQDDAADFIYARDRALVLAPVGAGKTATALTAMVAMLADGHVRRWLVLAPLRVCQHVWAQEAAKWAPGLTVNIATGSPAARKAAFARPSQVVVVNYDALQILTAAMLDGFDGVVFDELTRLKNPSGKRFKAFEKLIDRFNIRWGLTGSFTSNGLEDVFGQCKIIDQKLLGRAKGAFLQQYFYCVNREIGDWSPRKGSLEQVMARIRPATYVLEAGEYSDKLPSLHVVETPCEMDDLSLYNRMKRDFLVQFPEATVLAANAAAVTSKLQQMASGFAYSTTSTAAAQPGKFDSAREAVWFSSHKFDALDALLAENQRANTIIVYNFKEELAELRRRYPRAQTIDDEGAIDRWNAGKIGLLLVHPKSAGHGLNLQFGGNHIVFLSLPWSLELFEQTVGRLHRSGQTKDVWCYLLICAKTVDERIWAALQDKRSLSDVALEELRV